MHIIHYNLTTTTKEGGVETFVWDLACEQALRGAQVTIIGGAGSIRRTAFGVAVRTVPFVDRRRFAVGPLRRAYAWRKLAERLSMLPAALPLLHDADLVHIHKPYDLPLAPLLRQRGIPVVYHGHGEDFFRGDRALMRFVPALLSCSSYNAVTLRQHYGREATIVYNGVDVEHFQPQPLDQTLRNQLAGDARWLVMQPGRIMPWKGHTHSLQALSLLANPLVRLVVIGDGENRSTLEQQAQTLGIADQVLFTGTIPHRELPRYFAAADIVLGSSYASETFGMALAEAQACGRPVLASSWRGYDDVVQAGETGERFTASDPTDLAHKLQMMFENPAYSAELAAAGCARVIRLFQWSAIAERVEQVYHNVAIHPAITEGTH